VSEGPHFEQIEFELAEKNVIILAVEFSAKKSQQLFTHEFDLQKLNVHQK